MNKKQPLPKPNELWPFTRVDAKILERMHREHMKNNKEAKPQPVPEALL